MSSVDVSVGNRPFRPWKMLMVAERTKIGLINSEVKEMIENMDAELTKVIEDFMRAVDVEALYLTKISGKHSLPQSICRFQ